MICENNIVLSQIDLDDNNMVKIDDGVRTYAYFCQTKPLRIDNDLIEKLKTIFFKVEPRNVRLCLHESPEEMFHDMIILERKSRYYRPHCHHDKGESFHIIEGEMGVFTFNSNGDVVDSCILTKNDVQIYKVKPNMYHAVMPLSEYVIYHETKPGPFIGIEDSIYPDWAPKGNDLKEIDNYIKSLRKTIT